MWASPSNMIYKDYLKTKHWKTIRKQKNTRTLGVCQICGNVGLIDVHHRYYKRSGSNILGKEKMMDLKTLCRDCHEKYHKYFGKRPMRLKYIDIIKNWIKLGKEKNEAFKLVASGVYSPRNKRIRE